VISGRRLSVLFTFVFSAVAAQAQQSTTPTVFGYHDFSRQAKVDKAFMAVPDPKLAGEHLKELTKAPHIASSPEDHATAEYVAAKFRAAGLETEIVPYRIWMNLPKKIEIDATDASGKTIMTGPQKEHVGPEFGGDPFQDDPRVTPGFNGEAASGDVTAEVVYANYGTPADFKKLADMGISVKGKIVITRYGENFRGVKVFIAQQYGAAGVLIYSDPADDGYMKGDIYPRGPWRPESAVQRGSVQFLAHYSGDPETPGIASTLDLPDSKRLRPDQLGDNLAAIPSTPLSYHDAEPILHALLGPATPREWQGGLPFAYHLGPGGVKVHMHLEMDYQLRTIWDVIGKIPGTDAAGEWVVAGNHRDAWVYGAVDPNSGTAAMLETVHGLGELLKQGWKPRRTVIIGSWDAEEEGLIGSTEWAEQHEADLKHAVAYINTDVGVSGPHFGASAVPSLKEFVRDVTREVPSPAGGTVYEQWLKDQSSGFGRGAARSGDRRRAPVEEVNISDLGSGSDYTPFLQHLGVPSTDVGSNGDYGVYHSVFDNYNWFIKFADPTFVYEQQMARVFGLEILHMADADVLPYDYELYGKNVVGYVDAAKSKAQLSDTLKGLDFTAATAAAKRFAAAGVAIHQRQTEPSCSCSITALNLALRDAEAALLTAGGLPRRPWYKHTIYAPGEYTGYAAVVIPGVNEAVEANDAPRAQAQLTVLADALDRSAAVLEAATK